MKLTKYLTFDDVLLVPQYSTLKSRAEANPATTIANMSLAIPIVSANMDTVTELPMARAMSGMGGLGILHRYASVDSVSEWVSRLVDAGHLAVPSIGVQSGDLEAAKRYVDQGAQAICVDVAHGDSLHTIEMVKKVSVLGVPVIAGNVATLEGARRLAGAGAATVKVGVGPGAVCQTRVVTGHGIPQLSAIMDVADLKNEFPSVTVIADGGIRNGGDIVKALAAGADAVMIGSLLAGTIESPGDVTGGYKIYRGMASAEAQLCWRGSVSNKAPEGVSVTVPYVGAVGPVVAGLVGGIKSGMSYSGARTLAELREAAQFVEITSNGVKENGPHAKAR